jgi:hypothetical protein
VIGAGEPSDEKLVVVRELSEIPSAPVGDGDALAVAGEQEYSLPEVRGAADVQRRRAIDPLRLQLVDRDCGVLAFEAPAQLCSRKPGAPRPPF